MVQLDQHNVRKYLELRLGGSARILAVSVLGQEAGAQELKGYGYGVPVKIEYESSRQRHAAVLETITPGPFGHEHMADNLRPNRESTGVSGRRASGNRSVLGGAGTSI